MTDNRELEIDRLRDAVIEIFHLQVHRDREHRRMLAIREVTANRGGPFDFHRSRLVEVAARLGVTT
jgi:hypothetical protein